MDSDILCTISSEGVEMHEGDWECWNRRGLDLREKRKGDSLKISSDRKCNRVASSSSSFSFITKLCAIFLASAFASLSHSTSYNVNNNVFSTSLCIITLCMAVAGLDFLFLTPDV